MHRTVAALTLAALAAAPALAATPGELLSRWGGSPDAARGQRFFTQPHGREWSCASCHGTPPTQPGRHAGTGRAIGTLAPAFNPERFSDPAKVEKWLRHNCNDVLGRECSSVEKADVLAWLMTLKP